MVVAGFASVRVDGDILLRLDESLLSDVGVLNKVEQLRSVVYTTSAYTSFYLQSAF